LSCEKPLVQTGGFIVLRFGMILRAWSNEGMILRGWLEMLIAEAIDTSRQDRDRLRRLWRLSGL
jgi:hypothetical protein